MKNKRSLASLASRATGLVKGAGRMLGGATVSMAGVPQAGVPMFRKGAHEAKAALGLKKKGKMYKMKGKACKMCGSTAHKDSMHKSFKKMYGKK